MPCCQHAWRVPPPGIDLVLIKPLGSRELIQAIRNVCDRRNLGEKNAGRQLPETCREDSAEDALARLGGRADLLAELTEMFLAETPLLVAELQAAADSGDWPTLHLLAHRLQGQLSRSLAAVRRWPPAQRLEAGTRAGDPQAVAAAWHDLQPQLADLIQTLFASV